jgi:hypothetical protein
MHIERLLFESIDDSNLFRIELVRREREKTNDINRIISRFVQNDDINLHT